MLEKLQRNFMVLTMTLLALVLFGTFAISYTTTQQQLGQFVMASLDRVLDTTTPMRPYIGVLAASGAEDRHNYGQMAVYWIDIDRETGRIVGNDTAAIIGPKAVSTVLAATDATEDETGFLPDFDIVWKRGETPSGERIAVANTTGIGQALSNQLYVNIAVGVSALGVIAAIMWRLSRWIVRPVELSWDAQRQFTADASHELKTPLAVILANTHILKRDLERIPEDDRRWIESTDMEAERMKELVTGLLELSRADEDRFNKGSVYHLERCDLSELVGGMTTQFDVVAFESGHMLEEDIQEGVFVQADPGFIEKVVKILLDNAVKYSTRGDTVDVSLSVNARRRQAVFSVRNYGDTLSATDIEHIFDRFYRTDKARSRTTGGFGLGLPIAKAIIDGHDGTISCESSDEGGTRFTFSLPLS
ncbi:HAMP domain-containing sensor histidine kinase [Atopobiaceae bacterium 24-176]